MVRAGRLRRLAATARDGLIEHALVYRDRRGRRQSGRLFFVFA
jgi:hypothetical protein